MTAFPASSSDGGSSIAYVGLGSSLGDRAWALREAIRRLGSAGQRIEAVSPVFETAPVECAGPPFYNAVARLNTSMSPTGLLGLLLDTEAAMGVTRTEGPRQPRVIDLDLLLYNDLVLSTPCLRIPHPHLVSRRFVLEPLSCLAPALLIPGQTENVAVLAKRLALSAPEQAVRLVRSLFLGPKIVG